jgi:hypothetical protein
VEFGVKAGGIGFVVKAASKLSRWCKALLPKNTESNWGKKPVVGTTLKADSSGYRRRFAVRFVEF